MGDNNFLLFTISLLATPAIVLGIIAGLPVWLLWLLQKLFHRNPTELNWFGIVSVGLLSFISVFCLYAYLIISMDYVFTIPSSPIAAEKQTYANAAIAEAFQLSIIPPILQIPCTAKPEIICKLGQSYSLKLWDSNLLSDGEPYVGGFISSIISMLFVLLGNFVFQNRKAHVGEVDSKINALLETGDVDALLKLLENEKDWMTRLDAAEALAKIGNEQGVNYLISALDAPNADIRDVAKEILEGLNNQRGNLALQSHYVGM